MGQQQVRYARFLDDKQPGQTASLRNILIKDGEGLIKDLNGMGTIQEIYE